MKGKPLCLTVAVLFLIPLILSGFPGNVKAEKALFSGGSGTPSDPFIVETATDLDNVRNYLDANFFQTKHIDLASWGNWEPIGNETNPFTGVYNGALRKVSNLTIAEGGNPGAVNKGLFGSCAQSGYLFNIIIEDVSINSYASVGSVVGQNFGTIAGCLLYSGSVEGNQNVGGLAGNNNGAISNCYSYVSVSGNKCVGGLVGRNEAGTIKQVFVIGSITGTESVGGLVGCLGDANAGNQIRHCYVNCSVSGSEKIGGLIGSAKGSLVVADCYSYSSVTLPSWGTFGGGLIGQLEGSIENCYSIGPVNGGTGTVGGLVGGYANTGSAQNCYYDSQTSGQSDTGKGTPKTTAEMKTGTPSVDIFTNWDLDLWQFTPNNQYPQHKYLAGNIHYDFSPIDVANYFPKWTPDGGATWLESEVTYPVPPGTYTISFRELKGWNTPGDQNLVMVAQSDWRASAIYSRKIYTVAVTVTPDGSGTINGTGTYLYDYPATLKAIPATGYHFVEWGVGKTPLSTENPITFTVTNHLIMWARFALNEYTIAASPSLAAGGTITGSGNYTHGDSVTLTATPSPGYNFRYWTENGSPIIGEGSSYTFTAERARKLVAIFTKYGVERVAGSNRYGTAVEISKKGWVAASTVVIARGDDYADALAGVPLAFQLDAPILLTNNKRLTAITKEEIIRLGASEAVILGGEGAVAKAVADELEGMGMTVRRIAGSGRYGTASSIALDMRSRQSITFAFLAVGTDFADALSASAYAARLGCPILLTQQGRLPTPTADLIDSLQIYKVYVIGGTGVISEDVIAQLSITERIAGSNRYATGLALAERFLPGSTQGMYLATGVDFPDAIAGGVLAAKNANGVLLTRGDRPLPNEGVQIFFKVSTIRYGGIFGGAGAISTEIEEWLIDNVK